MSNVDNPLLKRYAELCQAYGDLMCKKETIDRAITNIKTQIEGLDIAMPEFKKYDDALKKQALEAKQSEKV